jgi:hypothetical protein
MGIMNKREIKFRVWNAWGSMFEKNPVKKMKYFDLTGLDGDFITSSGGYLHEGCNVMQYTGIEDKNGNKIYEGDILQAHDHEDKLITQPVIWWSCGWYVGYDEPDGKGIRVTTLDHLTEIEIVGNIYEDVNLKEK